MDQRLRLHFLLKPKVTKAACRPLTDAINSFGSLDPIIPGSCDNINRTEALLLSSCVIIIIVIMGVRRACLSGSPLTY